MSLAKVPEKHHLWSCITHLPFKLQRRFLSVIQGLLEQCVIDFARRWASSILVQQGWTDLEQVELHLWLGIISKYLVPNQAIGTVSDSYHHCLERMKLIRHWAVHRQRDIPVVILSVLVRDATNLAKCLEDSDQRGRLLKFTNCFVVLPVVSEHDRRIPGSTVENPPPHESWHGSTRCKSQYMHENHRGRKSQHPSRRS